MKFIMEFKRLLERSVPVLIGSVSSKQILLQS